MPRSRTPKGRQQAGSRHPRNDEHRQSKSLYQSPFSIPYATISLLCHLRESRHPHNNQHPKQFTPTNQARSRTLYRPRTSQSAQKLPCTATAVFKTEKNLQINAAVAVQGSSGWVREVWRVGRPLRKGSPCASKVFPYLNTGYPAAVCAAMRSSQRETISSVES